MVPQNQNYKPPFLSISFADSRYCLLVVNLFTSKFHTYPLKYKNPLKSKWICFGRKYIKIEEKRYNDAHIKTDREINQKERNCYL